VKSSYFLEHCFGGARVLETMMRRLVDSCLAKINIASILAVAYFEQRNPLLCSFILSEEVTVYESFNDVPKFI